jgi:hypothetical protein
MLNWEKIDPQLGKYPDPVIAKKYKTYTSAISRRRYKLNIKAYRKPDYIDNPCRRFQYVQDILKENNVRLSEFAKILDSSNVIVRQWIKGAYEPSFFSIQCICIALEEITEVSRQEHSLFLLWGEG